MAGVRLYHQYDGFSHTWILDGIGFRVGRDLASVGWKWASGLHRPGAWYTHIRTVADHAAVSLRIAIEEVKIGHLDRTKSSHKVVES